jgi:DNA-binding transcriptional ArsR family regulator
MTNAVAAIQALSALGDPSRRAIFERLVDAPASVGEIARAMPVTRSAVSQHLRVLKEAGLVSETPDGTRRIYRLDPAGIAAIRDWLDAQWATSLEAFGEFADQQTNAEAKEKEQP